jgi:rhomboid protease GluP
MTPPSQSASKPGRPGPRVWALALGLVAALWLADTARALLEPAGLAATWGGRASVAVLLELGAKVNAWVAAGQLDRLVLAGWLHASAAHLVQNSLWLGVAAVAGAWLDGVPAAFGAAVFGSVAGFGLSALFGAGPSVGASAMILGLAGLVVATLVADGALVARGARRLGLVALGGALVATLVPGIEGGAGAPTDHAAHLGGLGAGLVVGYLVRRGFAPAEHVAAAAALLLFAAAGLTLARPTLPPASSNVVALEGAPGLWLPALKRQGQMADGRCDPSASGRLYCATDGLELVAAAGPVADLATADPVLAAAMPPPGRCARYTAPSEQVLIVRPDADHAMVLAVLPSVSARYSGLRDALSAARCPGM